MDLRSIKENSEEIQDYFRDLQRWETEMKAKDEEILRKRKTQDNQEDKHEAPIRSRKKDVDTKKDRKKLVPSQTDHLPIPKEFRKEKMDIEKRIEERSSNETEEEQVEKEKLKQKATLLKEKGNKLFGRGKYKEAIECYNEGIIADSTNALLYANRAMAYLKTGQIKEAEQDCTTSILLDYTYVKAFHRRGTCRLALNKYQLARQDFLKVIEMEPTNKSARLELDKIQKEFLKRDKNLDDLKKTLKDVSADSTEDVVLPGGSSISQMSCIEGRLNYNVPGRIYPVDVPVYLKSKKPLTRIYIQDEEIRTVKKQSKSVSRCSYLKETLKNEVKEIPKLPGIPQFAVQFELDWRTLKDCPILKLEYLKQFPLEKIAVIFKKSMEFDIFSDMIEVLHKFYEGNKDLVFLYMRAFPNVGRFQTLSLFISDDLKHKMKAMLEDLTNMQISSKEETDFLMKLYSI